MTLHIFNPEHDIALAANLANFTAPHAGRQLRADLCWLPALWAGDGDAVLVDHVGVAARRYHRLRARYGGGDPVFVDRSALRHLAIDRVEPWGWDLALRAQLLRHGVASVPDEAAVAQLRQLSHRRTAARLLPVLRIDGTVGEAFECGDEAAVGTLLSRYDRLVLKAPWSSSGRGVRFVSRADGSAAALAGWLRNVLRSQGSVMVEPYYNKVKDFGVEFDATADGIRLLGLSLFHTQNGAYTGNVVATERQKRDALARYVPLDLLDDICHLAATHLDLGDYRGPFGIDMMVVRGAGGDGFRLHPCVEVNVRRTMGHVALALTPPDGDARRVMRVRYDGESYKLSVRKY